MGIFQSCLSKNNKVGVVESEDADVYHLPVVQQSVMTDAKGGVAFKLTFEASEKTKLPRILKVNSQKEENFEKWRVSQERLQLDKQKRAKENRDKERIQKQIESAQEMDRLEKDLSQKRDMESNRRTYQLNPNYFITESDDKIKTREFVPQRKMQTTIRNISCIIKQKCRC